MHRISFFSAVAVLAALSIMGADTPAKPKANTVKPPAAVTYGNADSINEQELKIYNYFLASDQLEGRSFPSRGYDTAALYVASHLAEWGLKPGGSTTGTNGPLQPYLMPIEMLARTVVPADSRLSLTATTEPHTTTFEYGKDWSVAAGRGAPPLDPLDVSGSLVFAGNGYVIHKTKVDPYQGLDVRGKIIVVAGLPPEMARQQAGGRAGRGPNPLGEACTDYLTPAQSAARNGAAAVVSIATYQQLTAAGQGAGRGPNLNGPNFQVKNLAPSAACPSVPTITAGVELTNALFQGEKLSGSRVFYGAGSDAKLESFAFKAGKTVSLRIAVHNEAGHGENVIGILEGSDPVLKNEYVILSAHLDHIGLSAPLPDAHNVNNGADDDGSGSSGLLAIAHAYAEGAAKGMRPRRSVMFLWNGGEEKGLWGSQYFTEFPPIDLTHVVADLNLDMIGRTRSPDFVDSDSTHMLVRSGEVLVVGPHISSDELGQTIDTVNANYQKMSINHFYDVTAPDATHDNLGPQPRGQRIFYRSDHYNFARMGIPIAFFTVGLHPDYHRPTDTPDKVDYKQVQTIAKTVAAVAWDLGNQNGRPKLKTDLPDQLVRDMKTAKNEGWGKVTPVLPPLPGEPF